MLKCHSLIAHSTRTMAPVGLKAVFKAPWLVAENNKTFLILSTEENTELDKFSDEEPDATKDITYKWGTVKYYKTDFVNVVLQERMDPYPEHHEKYGSKGSIRTLIRYIPAPRG